MKTVFLRTLAALAAVHGTAQGAAVIISNVATGPGDTLYAHGDGRLMNGGVVTMGYFPADVSPYDIDSVPELLGRLSQFTAITSVAPGAFSTTLGSANPGYADQADFTSLGTITYGNPLLGRTLYSIITDATTLQLANVASGFALVAVGTVGVDEPLENQYIGNPGGLIPVLGFSGTFSGDAGAGNGSYHTLRLAGMAAPQTHTLRGTVEPAAGGSISGIGTYPANSQAVLTATARPGFVFAGWTGRSPSNPNIEYGYWKETLSGQQNPLQISFDYRFPDQIELIARFLPDNGDSDGDGLLNADEVAVYQTDPFNSDTDGDGLNDGAEVRTHLTHPLHADSDGDRLTDGDELLSYRTYNPNATDSDGDGLADGDEDYDGDGLSNATETGADRFQLIEGRFNRGQAAADAAVRGGHLASFTSMAEWQSMLSHHGEATLFADRDGWWIGASDREVEGTWIWSTGETFFFHRWAVGEPDDFNGGDDAAIAGELAGTPGKWYDLRGTAVRGGYVLETDHPSNPLALDSDRDGLNDGVERQLGTDPRKVDTDSDGLTDREEVQKFGSNPLLPDSDGDGVLDGDEDADGDRLGNLVELRSYMTDPFVADTNGDGLFDGTAVELKLNPLGAYPRVVAMIGSSSGALQLRRPAELLASVPGSVQLLPVNGAFSLRLGVDAGTDFSTWLRIGAAAGQVPANPPGSHPFYRFWIGRE